MQPWISKSAEIGGVEVATTGLRADDRSVADSSTHSKVPVPAIWQRLRLVSFQRVCSLGCTAQFSVCFVVIFSTTTKNNNI